MFLGNDYITDEIVVETADHARLAVRYSVNNHFNIDAMRKAGVERLFRFHFVSVLPSSMSPQRAGLHWLCMQDLGVARARSGGADGV